MKKSEIENQLSNYLEYLKSSGVKSVSRVCKKDEARFKKTELLKESVSKHEGNVKEAALSLDSLEAKYSNCIECSLGQSRNNIVFGVGNPKADLVFVGEAPGKDEDLNGEPFVGKSGQLLTKIIEAIDLSREEVYICNIVKCRPPENRNPLPEEIKACNPILQSQLDAIKPKVICALGKFAAQTLLNTETAISSLRGSFHNYHDIPLMPTYHPAYLLRNPKMKRAVWEDVKLIRKTIRFAVKVLR